MSPLGTGGRSTVEADIRRHREAYYEEHPEAVAFDAEAPQPPPPAEMTEEQLEEERRRLWGGSAPVPTLAERLAAVTRNAVLEALVAHHGAWGPAAAALGVSRSTLARLLREHFAPGELEEMGRTLRWPTAEERAAKARAARQR